MKTKFIVMSLLIMAISVGMATAYMGSGMRNSGYGGMSGGYGDGHNSMHNGYGGYGDWHNTMHGYGNQRTRQSSRYSNYGNMHDYNTMNNHMNTMYSGARGSMYNQDNRYGSRYSDEDRPRTSRYSQRTQRSSRNSWWNWN